MAGKYLRDSKGRYAGSTTGWQKGKRVAGRTVSGARRKVSAHNNRVLRQEAFVVKGQYYERGLTRGDRNTRVAANFAGAAAAIRVHPIAGRVGSSVLVGKVTRRQQNRSLVNGQAKSINAKRASQLQRQEFVRSMKVQIGTTAAVGVGVLGARAVMSGGRGMATAHFARESSLKANRALGAGLTTASRNRKGVYNVTSMNSKMGTGKRIRLGGQRLSAAAKFAANAG